MSPHMLDYISTYCVPIDSHKSIDYILDLDSVDSNFQQFHNLVDSVNSYHSVGSCDSCDSKLDCSNSRFVRFQSVQSNDLMNPKQETGFWTDNTCSRTLKIFADKHRIIIISYLGPNIKHPWYLFLFNLFWLECFLFCAETLSGPQKCLQNVFARNTRSTFWMIAGVSWGENMW